MPRPMSDPRPLRDLRHDCGGQLVTEWVLLTTVITLPFVLFAAWSVDLLYIYYYRAAGVFCLPFP